MSAIVGKKMRAKLHCRSFPTEVRVWSCGKRLLFLKTSSFLLHVQYRGCWGIVRSWVLFFFSFFFLAWTVSSEQFFQENAAVMCDVWLHWSCWCRLNPGPAFSIPKDPHRRALWIVAEQQKDLHGTKNKKTFVSVAILLFWESHSQTPWVRSWIHAVRCACIRKDKEKTASLAERLGQFKLSVGQYPIENRHLGICLYFTKDLLCCTSVYFFIYSKQADFPTRPVHLRTLWSLCKSSTPTICRLPLTASGAEPTLDDRQSPPWHRSAWTLPKIPPILHQLLFFFLNK